MAAQFIYIYIYSFHLIPLKIQCHEGFSPVLSSGSVMFASLFWLLPLHGLTLCITKWNNAVLALFLSPSLSLSLYSKIRGWPAGFENGSGTSMQEVVNLAWVRLLTLEKQSAWQSSWKHHTQRRSHRIRYMPIQVPTQHGTNTCWYRYPTMPF